jgi:hypothetical protein
LNTAHNILPYKHPFSSEEICGIFEDALKEEPPPSLREVLQRIGQSISKIQPHIKNYCRDIVERHQIWRNSDVGKNTVKQRGRRTIATDPRIIQRLAEATQEVPPVSLARVALELNCHPSALKRWHPENCEIILDRYSNRKDWANVQKMLQNALALQAPPYPSLAEICRQVGELITTMENKFPEECQEISNRYRLQHMDMMRQELKKALHEYPPPSFREVTRRCGRATSTLNHHYPELCTQVVERYAAHVQERARQKEQQLQQEIRQAVMRVHEEGRYPSLRQIQSYLSQPAMMLSSTCMDTWRTILCELGYRDHPNKSSNDSEHEE